MKRIILHLGIIDIILLWLMSLTIYHAPNYVDDSFLLAQNTIITNQKDLYNMINNSLTTKNNIFTCSSKYANCINDLKELFNNKELLNIMNNRVNPYDSYKTISVSYLSDNTFKINIKKNYSEEDIIIINNKIDKIINNIINNNMTNKEKVKVVHDYLIKNAVYDLDNKDKSNTAYGALIKGYTNCQGYADAYSLLLNKLNISNYKIVNNNHVWNAVKIDNKWYQIDVTYDAPLISFNENIIRYDCFLKDSLNDKDHTYNKELYNILI